MCHRDKEVKVAGEFYFWSYVYNVPKGQLKNKCMSYIFRVSTVFEKIIYEDPCVCVGYL